jgi:hypothetical protein
VIYLLGFKQTINGKRLAMAIVFSIALIIAGSFLLADVFAPPSQLYRVISVELLAQIAYAFVIVSSSDSAKDEKNTANTATTGSAIMSSNSRGPTSAMSGMSQMDIDD